MERRDRTILQKVLREIEIAGEMMNGCSLEEFQGSELLMRALGMTVIDIGELGKNLSDQLRQTYRRYPGRRSPDFATLPPISTRPFGWTTCMRPS